MSIQVKHYGNTKPGPGVEPVKVENTPFGKKNPVGFMSGKHVFQPEVKKIDVVYQNRKYTKDTEDWQYSQMEEHDGAEHGANFPAMAPLPTDHLFVPDDDSIAPFYTTREAFYWYGEDSAGGMTKTAITSDDDPRNYGEFIKLTRPVNRTEMHFRSPGREIDGSISSVDGIKVATDTSFVVHVRYGGDEDDILVTHAVDPATKYWIAVDTTQDLMGDAISIGSGASYPGTAAFGMVYFLLMEVNPDETGVDENWQPRIRIERGAWTEVGNATHETSWDDLFIRFTEIVFAKEWEDSIRLPEAGIYDGDMLQWNSTDEIWEVLTRPGVDGAVWQWDTTNGWTEYIPADHHILDGNNHGDLLQWDATANEWVLLNGFSDEEMLRWDSTLNAGAGGWERIKIPSGTETGQITYWDQYNEQWVVSDTPDDNCLWYWDSGSSSYKTIDPALFLDGEFLYWSATNDQWEHSGEPGLGTIWYKGDAGFGYKRIDPEYFSGGEIIYWDQGSLDWVVLGSAPQAHTLLYWDASSWKYLQPPSTGNYVLMSKEGAIQWVELETFTCPV